MRTRRSLRQVLPRVRFGLIVAYPVCVHLAVVTGSRVLVFVALVALAANGLSGALTRGSTAAWIVFLAAVGGSALVAVLGAGHGFFFAAPVVIFCFFLSVFAYSLRPGQVPMITRIAAAMRRGGLPAPVVRYTRALTVVWVVVFAVLALVNALLAAFAPIVVWSAFANCINYILVIGLFVLEWPVRRWVLDRDATGRFVDYWRQLRTLDWPEVVRDDD